MGIADERRIAELRYRAQRNKNFIRAIGFITSTIPAILIAFNFEAFRQYAIVALGGQPQPQVQQQAESPAAVAQSVVQQRAQSQARPDSSRTEQSPRAQRRQLQEPPPFFDGNESPEDGPAPKPRRPVQLVRPETVTSKEPGYVITLDLTRQRQYVPNLSLAGSEKILIRGGDVAQRISRSIDEQTVTVGSEAVLVLDKSFRPRINITLEPRAAGHVLCLVYCVDDKNGKELPFTIKNLRKIRLAIVKSGQNAQALLASMESKLIRLKEWLKSYTGKLWTDKREAEQRVRVLPELITAQKILISELQQEFAAVDQLIRLAESLNGSTLYAYVER